MTSKTTTEVSAATNLRHRIMQLKSQRAEQEERLKRDLREVVSNFTPSNIIKNTVHDLKSDPEFRQDAIKQGISVGTGFLLDAMIFRNGFGIKSSLISAGLKKVVSHFVNRRRGA